MLRQPIFVVMGHVDSGKTSLLDSIRATAVASREAGGITQSIGASEIPVNTICGVCSELLQKMKVNLTIPGILAIDTPGHEAFSNLRVRGGSVADIAILAIDVTKGVEPQTVESLQILKQYKVPFIVAANKIDLLTGWIPQEGKSFSESSLKQRKDVLEELDKRIYKIVEQLYSNGFSSERFDRVSDFTKEIVIVPTSARWREGIQELLLFVAGLAQKFLEKRLEVGEQGKGTILEIKEEKGLGKTLDVILYDGTLRNGDEIIFAGANGVISSRIKALLKPKPLDEMRDPREKFTSVPFVSAACGIKIACEKAGEGIAGSSLYAFKNSEQEEQARKLIEKELKEILVETEANGVILKGDALGSLEAITKLFSSEKIPIRKALIGRVVKKDVVEAYSVGQQERFLGVIFAFNTEVDDDAEAAANALGVKIFREKIIYNLITSYRNWVEEEKARERRELFNKLVLPAKILILANCCFRTSNPCIFGVEVVAGTIKKGYKMINAEGETVGEIKEIQHEKNSIEEAKKGMQVAISMNEPYFGRQVEEKMYLYSSIPKEDVKKIEEKYLQALSEEEKDLLKEIKRIKGFSSL